MSDQETTPTERIEELVTYIVTSLVDEPDTVEVDVESNDDDSDIRVLIRANSEDVGKIIGRGGRPIKSIRTLARATVGSPATHVDIDVEG